MLGIARASPGVADPQKEIRDLYTALVTAQNRHDIDAVRLLLSGRPDCLWISDGHPVWGREAMLARMAELQEAEVWQVEQDAAAYQVILLDEDTEVRHLPLLLVLGTKADPVRLQSLVEVICQSEAAGWRIVRLYTAQDTG